MDHSEKELLDLIYPSTHSKTTKKELSTLLKYLFESPQVPPIAIKGHRQ